MQAGEVIREYIMTKMITAGGAQELSETDSLIESGIVDSFGIMSLISFLEDEFSIKILADELIPDNFDSIKAITMLVDSKLNNKEMS